MLHANPIPNFPELLPNPGTIIGWISSCLVVKSRYRGWRLTSIKKSDSKSCTRPPIVPSIQYEDWVDDGNDTEELLPPNPRTGTDWYSWV